MTQAPPPGGTGGGTPPPAKSTSFTRDEWAQAFAPGASRRVLDWVIGWTLHEYGGAEAINATCSYNLLNTHGGGSSKCYADAGKVTAFSSVAEGAQANRAVLRENHPGYSVIEQAISAGDISTLTSFKVSQGLTTWVGAPTYAYLTPAFEVEGRGARNSTLQAKPPGGSPSTSPGGTNWPDGSCRFCLNGIPGACGTDQTCVGMNADGSVYALNGITQLAGTCVPNAYRDAHFASDGKHNDGADSPATCEKVKAGDQSAGGGSIYNTGGNTLGLPNWIANPDWNRVAKFILGLVAVGFGLIILVGILTGKADTAISSSGVTRGVSKVVAAVS